MIRLAAALAVFTLSARATPAQTLTDGRFEIDTVASLPPFTPVGMAFAPDGRIFFWQKSGVVRIVKDGALLATPFADISDHVNNGHDRGLLVWPSIQRSTQMATCICSTCTRRAATPLTPVPRPAG